MTCDGFSGCTECIFGRAEVGYKTQQAIVALERRLIRLVFHPDRIRLAVCKMTVQPVKCRIHFDRTAGEFSSMFRTELAYLKCAVWIHGILCRVRRSIGVKLSTGIVSSSHPLHVLATPTTALLPASLITLDRRRVVAPSMPPDPSQHSKHQGKIARRSCRLVPPNIFEGRPVVFYSPSCPEPCHVLTERCRAAKQTPLNLTLDRVRALPGCQTGFCYILTFESESAHSYAIKLTKCHVLTS